MNIGAARRGSSCAHNASVETVECVQNACSVTLHEDCDAPPTAGAMIRRFAAVVATVLYVTGAHAADKCVATLSGSSRFDQASTTPQSLKDADGTVARFAYKQADRLSGDATTVASARLDSSEPGGNVLALSIDDTKPKKQDSTAAYKVALTMPVRQVDRDIQEHAFDDGVLKLTSSFSMKIDGAVSSFKNGAPVIFHQFWQGSAFHPALTLAIVSDRDVPEGDKGAAEASAHFEVRIANDDHSPTGNSKTPLLRYNLGPAQVDRWVRWEVRLALDQRGRGAVEVFKDGIEVWRAAAVQVGFDRTNPRYGSQPPNRTISSVDLLIYRPNWAGKQSIRFKRFVLCAS